LRELLTSKLQIHIACGASLKKRIWGVAWKKEMAEESAEMERSEHKAENRRGQVQRAYGKKWKKRDESEREKKN
jgi:hypothetical protein